jgi:hypothetical protein
MDMPRHLIALGFLALVVVAMGFVSVIRGSWDWSAATASSIVLWLALAVVVPKFVHRPKGTPKA